MLHERVFLILYFQGRFLLSYDRDNKMINAVFDVHQGDKHSKGRYLFDFKNVCSKFTIFLTFSFQLYLNSLMVTSQMTLFHQYRARLKFVPACSMHSEGTHNHRIFQQMKKRAREVITVSAD